MSVQLSSVVCSLCNYLPVVIEDDLNVQTTTISYII